MAVYYLRAGDHLLEAWSLAELSELIECALDAGDPLTWLRAAGGRQLTDNEFGAVVAHLATSASARRPLRGRPDEDELP